MKNLKIQIYKSRQDTKPETSITIPLSVIHLGLKLLPKKIRLTMEKEGIDLIQCNEFTKEKDLKGDLIEIENPNEKIVISLE